nr:4096_t:CDS:2 [Entrophospora candida]
MVPVSAKEISTKKNMKFVCKALCHLKLSLVLGFVTAESIKSSLAGKLTDVFQRTGGAFTTDLWTDDYNEIH